MNLQTGSGDGTVGKALDVLDQVAAFGRPVRFSEVLEESRFPKATLYRLLQALTRQGMLRFDADTGTYSPGIRLMRMAHAAWAQTSLAPIARPHIDALSAAVGETVHLAQLDGGHVLYVDKRNAARPIEMYSGAGKIGPVYCTGVGKAMLAFLPEAERADVMARQSWHRFTPATITAAAEMDRELAAIREGGVAYDREEHEPGIHCIALPVRGVGGRVEGAVSITSHVSRASLSDLTAWLPRLRDCVEKMERDLRDWRFPDREED